MARVAQGTPLFKARTNGTGYEPAGRAEKTLNVTLISFKPYDLEVTFELDGETYRVQREFVTAEPELHPDDKTIDRGALGAAGGSEGEQGGDDLDKKDREGEEGTPTPENEGSYPGDGETNPPTNEQAEESDEEPANKPEE